MDSASKTTLSAPAPGLDEGFTRLSSRVLELRMVLTGVALLAFVGLELAAVAYRWPETASALWQGLLLEMFAGREAGIPVAIGSGLPPWLIAQMSATQDVAIACITYPAFLWALHRFQDHDNLLMRRLRRLHARARQHQKFVHRWGPLGIFVFMLVPFLINGPLLGAAMGRVAGIATRFLITPVVGATVLASLMWTYAYDALFGLAKGLDPRIPPVLTVMIVALFVVGALVGELVDEGRERKRRA